MPTPLRPHLLVVDDEPSLREGLATALGFDYTVHTAATGAEAVALLKHHPIACIILDAILGDEHGLDLVPAFRALTPAPILLLTGQSTEELAIRAANTHVDRYLKKTGDLTRLRAAIHDLLPAPDPAQALAMRARQMLDTISPAAPCDPMAFAEQFGVSEVQLRRAFRVAFGMTPRRYLTERRMRGAAHLLGTTRLTVDQIAREAGYASGTRFGRVFRRAYGCTPTAYRADPRRGHPAGTVAAGRP